MMMSVNPMGGNPSMTSNKVAPSTEVKIKTATADTDKSSVAGGEQVTQRSETTPSVKKERKEQEQADSRGQESQQVSAEQIRKAVDQINRNISHSEAVFGIHEETNRVTIKIIDKETKELIKELPPEKTLDMISKVWELAGLLVDERR
ncbi:MAG: flagellar protein FlaG [Lachnospiraceae bacterium]|jgi:flagellar protein FlaG|nr:flagellar protein FlaG [Lachnospiraceae bacterium]